MQCLFSTYAISFDSSCRCLLKFTYHTRKFHNHLNANERSQRRITNEMIVLEWITLLIMFVMLRVGRFFIGSGPQLVFVCQNQSLSKLNYQYKISPLDGHHQKVSRFCAFPNPNGASFKYTQYCFERNTLIRNSKYLII